MFKILGVKVNKRLERLQVIEESMQDPLIISDMSKMSLLGKELRELNHLKQVYHDHSKLEGALAEAKQLLADPKTDADMRAMAEEEVEVLEPKQQTSLALLEELVIPSDPMDNLDVMIEVRAGTGGAEASLFVGDILKMYTKFAALGGFRTEILSQHLTEAGGIREVVFEVIGAGAFGRFKFESGVHRVQRVPKTEASGRIHTSAITVAAFPEVEDIEIEIKAEDIKVDVFRSGGPGGQSVNTTDSAVRLTHVPSGLVVKCQDEKSQLKNKNKAMKILKARLYDQVQGEKQKEQSQERKSKVGSGDRSEKIRTYNFPERRVTDHRINLTLHRLEEILQGDLNDVVDALHSADKQSREN